MIGKTAATAWFAVPVFLSAACLGAEFRWPEEPENLKVLPETTHAKELRRVMVGFSSGLGVRCQYCHVGEGDDLTAFDFPSDEKVEKQKAREMIKMVQAINATYLPRLTELETSPVTRLEVTCTTCHHGVARPELLGDLLADIVKTEGIAAAISKYRKLREDNYGGFAYDFGSSTLNDLGRRLASEDNIEAALQILDLEAEVNGESASTWLTRGNIEAQAGMTAKAILSLERGLKMAPDDWKPFYRRQIDTLRKPQK